MKNFLNSNDLFTIIDLIRREISKNNFNQNRVGNLLSIADQYIDTPTSTDSVDNITFDRDANGSISTVNATYLDSSSQKITVVRGLNPPITGVPDADYINNQMITGFIVETLAVNGTSSIVAGEVIRQNGYGTPTGVQFIYG